MIGVSRRSLFRPATVALVFASVVSVAARDAAARPEYADTIPNYNTATCDTCHPPGSQAAQNLFGQDIEALVGSPEADWWPAVRGTDSDGDGQTNGQELGDPCEVWTKGKTPDRNTGISNPGVAASVSPTPDDPDCGPGATTATTSSAAGGEGGAGATEATTVGAGGSGSVGATAGAGAGNAAPSTGPGMAKPPPATTYGTCSFEPAGYGVEDVVGILGGLVLALTGALRQRRPR